MLLFSGLLKKIPSVLHDSYLHNFFPPQSLIWRLYKWKDGHAVCSSTSECITENYVHIWPFSTTAQRQHKKDKITGVYFSSASKSSGLYLNDRNYGHTRTMPVCTRRCRNHTGSHLSISVAQNLSTAQAVVFILQLGDSSYCFYLWDTTHSNKDQDTCSLQLLVSLETRTKVIAEHL